MTHYPLHLGCTVARHKQVGVNAVVNARAGRQDLNDDTLEDLALQRDARAIQQRVTDRVRWYGPNSRFLRRRRERIAHLIDSYND